MIVRSAFAQLGYSPVMLALTVLMLALTYLAPPLLLLFGAACRGAVRRVRLARHEHRVPADLAGLRAPPLLALLLPLIALFYVAATVASAVLFWRGRGGYWKGRFQAARPARR